MFVNGLLKEQQTAPAGNVSQGSSWGRDPVVVVVSSWHEVTSKWSDAPTSKHGLLENVREQNDFHGDLFQSRNSAFDCSNEGSENQLKIPLSQTKSTKPPRAF